MAFTLADEEVQGYMARPRDGKGARELLLAYPYFEARPTPIRDSLCEIAKSSRSGLSELNGGVAAAQPSPNPRPLQAKAPMGFQSEGTYASAEAKIESAQTYEWSHGLGEIVTALIQDGGLTIEFVHEHRSIDYKLLDHMTRDRHHDDDGQSVDVNAAGRELGFGGWRLPAHQAELCPLMFSLRAIKPAAEVAK